MQRSAVAGLMASGAWATLFTQIQPFFVGQGTISDSNRRACAPICHFKDDAESHLPCHEGPWHGIAKIGEVNAASPLFLTVELTLQVHEEMIRAYGGSEGIRDRGLIASAVAQGQNAHHYGAADFFGIAAAHTYHLAESQAFIDDNKRTGAAVALSFLVYERCRYCAHQFTRGS